MYLIPISVPLFRDGARILLQTDWRRAVELLRDSLEGRYGDLVLVSPVLPADGPEAAEQRLEPLDELAGVRARSAYDARVRARDFWLREYRPYRALVAEELERAQVVHGGIVDLYRPMMSIAYGMGARRGIPTVLVQDTDTVLQVSELAGPGMGSRFEARAYAAVFERLCRRAVRSADLTLMKSGTLARRYAPYAKNLRVFEDTSYLSSEVASASVVVERLAAQATGRPLRFAFCGRLIARKGVADALEILAIAKSMGVTIHFEVIGGGPEDSSLRERARRLGLEHEVTFAGNIPYDAALIARLARSDALFFMPVAEDTPRMIFDGYAAALPLIGAATAYNTERVQTERAGLLLPRQDHASAARAIVELDRHRERLATWTRAAQVAARYHAADAWYARRAAWTHEAVERRRAAAARS